MRRNPYSMLIDCTPSQIPDVYPFPYIAWVPWPADSVVQTGATYDWVNSIDQMEEWLNASVGRRLVAWGWTCMDTPCHSACAVAFKLDRDRSMFLLRWGS